MCFTRRLRNRGAFIAKLTGSGGLAWAKAFESSSSSTFVRGLDLDAAGNIYASGTFNGTVDFDPSAGSLLRTTAGQSDIYVVKLTAAGNLTWAETFGGAGHDVNFGMAVDPAGVVHLTGYYRLLRFRPRPVRHVWPTKRSDHQPRLSPATAADILQVP